ncbi:hypothetical protein [Pseudalkalibacillus caeni]|uniref:Uncharacterized protein n=1 Tax=Exobacillus caeni TaxID=2574798 RepID=A0A5R9F6S7_9BACL|nr:hypothetical protein [Pseudalkalibacillus caeni]TLS36194.1 hypothetical protein FCL54_16290 [Pseudalkalibacillus caeni]
MGWFWIMITGILSFAWLIDHRRKKRRNDKHTRGIHPATKEGESSNYVAGDYHGGGGGRNS